MDDHRLVQAKSFRTRARNEPNSNLAAAYIRHALRWEGYALETFEDRQARCAREDAERAATKAARKVKLDLPRIAPLKTTPPTLPIKHTGRRVLLNQQKREARAQRQRERELIQEAKREAKRAAARLAPLPYGLPPLPY